MGTQLISLGLMAAEESEHNVLLPAVNELVWGSIAFAIFFGVMWKFALPMADKALKERTANIEGKLERAEQDRAEAQQLLAQYRNQLAEARTDAANIREEARAAAEVIRVELRQQSEQEAAAVLARAEQQLAAERQRAMRELQEDIGRLATELAGRIVGESLESEVRQRGTVDRFIAEMERSGAGAGPNGSGQAEGARR